MGYSFQETYQLHNYIHVHVPCNKHILPDPPTTYNNRTINPLLMSELGKKEKGIIMYYMLK